MSFNPAQWLLVTTKLKVGPESLHKCFNCLGRHPGEQLSDFLSTDSLTSVIVTVAQIHRLPFPTHRQNTPVKIVFKHHQGSGVSLQSLCLRADMLSSDVWHYSTAGLYQLCISGESFHFNDWIVVSGAGGANAVHRIVTWKVTAIVTRHQITQTVLMIGSDAFVNIFMIKSLKFFGRLPRLNLPRSSE